jgi:uncharacterized protein YegL
MRTTIYNLIILDASGSMSNKVSEVINGMNKLLKDIHTNQKKEKGIKNRVFITDFSSHGDFNVLVDNQKIKAVNPFTRKTYVPRAMTALYDAVAKSIALIPDDAKYVFVSIFTDGLENDSKEFNADYIKSKIEQFKEVGWDFNFFGTSEESMYQAQRMGINRNKTITYDDSEEGVFYSLETTSDLQKNYQKIVARQNRIHNDAEE